MRRFYGRALGAIPGLLWDSIVSVEGAIAVVLFLVLLFNQKIGTALLNWEGIDPRWAILPVGLVVVGRAARAIFHAYDSLEQRAARLDERLRRWEEQRPRIRVRRCHVDIEGSEDPKQPDLAIYRVTFINDPELPAHGATSNNVRAEIKFLDTEQNRNVVVEGHWHIPVRRMGALDVVHTLLDPRRVEATFGIGEWQILDIGIRNSENGRFYAMPGEGFENMTPALMERDFRIDGERARCRVRLRAVGLDEEFWFVFHNPNSGDRSDMLIEEVGATP